MRVLPPVHAPLLGICPHCMLVLVMITEMKNTKTPELHCALCYAGFTCMHLAHHELESVIIIIIITVIVIIIIPQQRCSFFEGAPARRQPPPGTASMSHQYPRAMPPGPQQSGHQEFDPGLLFQLLQAPSFAPAADEMNQNKRKHDQLQVGKIASCSDALWT